MKIKTTLTLILVISFTNIFAPVTFPAIEEGRPYVIRYIPGHYHTLPPGTQVHVFEKVEIENTTYYLVAIHKTAKTKTLVPVEMLDIVRN